MAKVCTRHALFVAQYVVERAIYDGRLPPSARFNGFSAETLDVTPGIECDMVITIWKPGCYPTFVICDAHGRPADMKDGTSGCFYGELARDALTHEEEQQGEAEQEAEQEAEEGDDPHQYSVVRHDKQTDSKEGECVNKLDQHGNKGDKDGKRGFRCIPFEDMIKALFSVFPHAAQMPNYKLVVTETPTEALTECAKFRLTYGDKDRMCQCAK
jgi:hypothetical protein